MTNTEIIAKLATIAGNSEYGKKVVAEFEATPNDADKKYGQDIKDRLDERLGELNGWLKRDEAKGTGNPNEVKEHIAIIEKMIEAIK